MIVVAVLAAIYILHKQWSGIKPEDKPALYANPAQKPHQNRCEISFFITSMLAYDIHIPAGGVVV